MSISYTTDMYTYGSTDESLFLSRLLPTPPLPTPPLSPYYETAKPILSSLDPIQKVVLEITDHIDFVVHQRRASMAQTSRAPYIAMFMNVTGTKSGSYKFSPVLQWKRYGRYLKATNGSQFITTLYTTLEDRVNNVRKKDTHRAALLGHGLIELGMCWEGLTD